MTMAILLDFNPLIIGAVHVAQSNMRSEELNVDFVRHLALNQILSYKKQFRGYGQIVVCCDSKNSWRKDWFPYYKASRKKAREDSAINWKIVFESIDTIKQELDEHFPYKVVYGDRAEADDVIAVVVKYLQENELDGNVLDQQPQKIMIVSADKDFKQLQSYNNVEQYSPLLGKKISESRPDLYLREHIIRGDTGDGVPNIFSDDDTFVGGKRQKPIRQEKLEKWLEAEGTSFIEDDVVLRNWHRNKRMVDFAEIPEEVQSSILERYNSASDKSNDLFNYFIKNRLKNLITDIQHFN
jgi:hypothetical protein